MIDTRIDTIIYQSQIYYRDLINTLVSDKKLGKALDDKWNKADEILGYLEALNYRDRLTDDDDILNVNFILECLIKLCELNYYPVAAPLTFQPAPAVIVGEQGRPGDTVIGPPGPAGLATDFQISLVSVPTVVDSFPIVDAKAARWDYIVIEATGEQRAGTLIGHWLPDGSDLEIADSSADDLGVGSTEPLTFSLEFLTGNIRLIATPASGIWNVVGTRYFIPNNGNGSGPITDVLPNGTIFIGNVSNAAQSRTVSGVINITNTGVTSFVAGSILNADINASAGITLTKLAALPTGNKVLLSNGAGFIIESTITNVNLASLDTTTSLTAQLAAKLADPMTTIGDILIRNGSNITARLGIGSVNQVLTVSGGLPSWVSLPSQLLTKTMNIGVWNMVGGGAKTVPHGLSMPDPSKIVSVTANIIDDLGIVPGLNLCRISTGGALALGHPEGGYLGSDTTNCYLYATPTGSFDSAAYSGGGNRGTITIWYLP